MPFGYGKANGIMSGLNEGITNFVNAVNENRKIADDRAYRDATLQRQGLIRNPDTGAYELTPEAQEEQRTGLLKSKFEQGRYDPSNPAVSAKRQVVGGLLKQAGIKDVDVSNSSDAELDSFMQPLETSAKFANARAQKEASQGLRLGQTRDKRFQALSETLDPTKMRGGQFAQYQKTVDDADRVLVLRDQQPDLNFDNRQMEEIALATARMLSGGSMAAQSTIKALLPKSAAGDLAKAQEYVLNMPKGAGQQAFAKRILETAERERDLAASKLQEVRYSRIAPFSDLEQDDPKMFAAVLSSKGITPEEYRAYAQAGYKLAKPKAKEDGLLKTPPAKLPKIGDVTPFDDGDYQFLGGNPNDPNRWKKVK